MRFHFIFSCIFFVVLSCSDDTATKAPQPLWKFKLRDVTDQYFSFNSSDQLPSSGDIAVFFGIKNGSPMMYGVNVLTGNMVWSFDNKSFTSSSASNGVVKIFWNAYVKDSIWVFPLDGKIYGMNIRTGGILWTTSHPLGYKLDGSITGAGEDFFCIATEPYKDGYMYKPMRGNVRTGAVELMPPDIPLSGKYNCLKNYGEGYVFPIVDERSGYAQDVMVSYSDNSDMMRANDAECPAGNGHWHVARYDINRKQWKYDKDLNLPDFQGYAPDANDMNIVSEGKFYSFGGTIRCFDIETGNQLWYDKDILSRSYVSPATMTLSEGKLFIAYSSGNADAFDAETGKFLYNFYASNPSVMLPLNGVLYFVASDLRLHAIEMSTGKELWKIDSPDYLADPSTSRWKFSDDIGIVLGKNGDKAKIIVHTFINAYAYEAIR